MASREQRQHGVHVLRKVQEVTSHSSKRFLQLQTNASSEMRAEDEAPLARRAREREVAARNQEEQARIFKEMLEEDRGKGEEYISASELAEEMLAKKHSKKRVSAEELREAEEARQEEEETLDGGTIATTGRREQGIFLKGPDPCSVIMVVVLSPFKSLGPVR